MARLEGADLTGGDLRAACLRGADLSDAILIDADLRDGTLLKASGMSGTSGGFAPTAADVGRVIAHRADLSRAKLARLLALQTDFTDARLRGAQLAGADLRNAVLTGASLAEADLSGADLAGATLRGSDLSHATWAGANFAEADLSGARDAVALPVLRKDFVLDRAMVLESSAMGADAVLLIASILAPAELREMVAAAHEAGMAALVEIHDERELDDAVGAGARIIGVNSRDLRDFTVDLARAEKFAPRIPDGIVKIAESGIRTAEDVARLERAGYRAFLVGESLLRAEDPGAALAELLSP
jgi:indole-3-glycerol phosphate synthase